MILNSQQGLNHDTTTLELFIHYFPIFLELTVQAYSWLLRRAKKNAMPLQKKQITETRQGEVAVTRHKRNQPDWVGCKQHIGHKE